MIHPRIFIDDSPIPGGVVRLADISSYLYKCRRFYFSWRPAFHHNGSLFYGDNYQKEWFYEDFLKNTEKFKRFLEIHLFSFQQKPKIKPIKGFFYTHYYHDDFYQFLSDVKNLRSSIKRQKENSAYIDSVNQKVRLFFIDYDTVEDNEKSAKVEELFSDLLKNSFYERIYLFPIMKNIYQFSELLWKSLDWSAYFGDFNVRFARKAFEHLTLIENPKWTINGIGYQKDNEIVYEIMNWNHRKRSELYIQTQQYYEEHDKAYKKFLQSLNDEG